jgi:hypothetical protein
MAGRSHQYQAKTDFNFGCRGGVENLRKLSENELLTNGASNQATFGKGYLFTPSFARTSFHAHQISSEQTETQSQDRTSLHRFSFAERIRKVSRAGEQILNES